MKKLISWSISNILILLLLIVGNVYAIPALYITALVIYVLTSLLAFGLVATLYSAAPIDPKLFKGKPTSKIPKWLDASYDLVVTGVLLYFGNIIIAGLYALHIVALWFTRVKIEKLAG